MSGRMIASAVLVLFFPIMFSAPTYKQMKVQY